MEFPVFNAENFPYLKQDIKKLTPEEKDELLTKLTRESKNIRLSFAGLVSSTEMCLQSNPNITAENLKTFLSCLKELGQSIESSHTIPEIMRKVGQGNYWSFFNYELLEKLIHQFCAESEKVIEKLKRYISDFKKYCQRRVSEVPHRTLKSKRTKSRNSYDFTLKMDKIFSIQRTKLDVLKEVQLNIQIILNLGGPVLLTNVKGGCIELSFRYFTSNRVFPLSEREKAALAEMNVKWLRYEDSSEAETETKHAALDHTHLQQQPSTSPATTSPPTATSVPTHEHNSQP